DSSCGSVIRTAAQSPPACSTAPGWTTGAAAQWQGSHFSSPQCNYQAPPSCPSGWIETVGPSWNGSAWVGMSCQIPAQPGPNTCQYGFASGPSWNGSAWVYSCNSAPASVTPADQQQACLTYGFAHDFYPIRPWAFGYQYNGPYDGTGASAYSPSVPLLAFTDPSSGEAIWSGKGSFSPPGSAPTQMVVVSGAAVDVCWFVPGTTNLIGQYNLEGVSSGGNGG
ncbi:hypothetical protein P3T25_005309, partial [Paraburkholderia sp. GAS32]